ARPRTSSGARRHRDLAAPPSRALDARARPGTSFARARGQRDRRLSLDTALGAGAAPFSSRRDDPRPRSTPLAGTLSPASVFTTRPFLAVRPRAAWGPADPAIRSD